MIFFILLITILKIHSFKIKLKLHYREKTNIQSNTYDNINISNKILNNEKLMKNGSDERYKTKESNEDIIKVCKYISYMELLIILQSSLSEIDKLEILNSNEDNHAVYNIKSGGLMDSWNFPEF